MPYEYESDICREKIAIRITSKDIFDKATSFFEALFGSDWRGSRSYDSIARLHTFDTCINISKDRMDFSNSKFYIENGFKVMTFEEYLVYKCIPTIKEEVGMDMPRRIRLRR
jgi:hypothetical protein